MDPVELQEIITNIRERYSNVPIEVFSDQPFTLAFYKVSVNVVETRWRNHRRYGYRNSDYWRLKGMLELDYDLFCYLDTDMKIVSDRFDEGFALAARFGFCAPINPRSFVGIDCVYGADPSSEPVFYSATAHNSSPIFASKQATPFIESYVSEMEANPTRGPAVLWRTALKSGLYPYTLAPEWCLCFSEIRKAVKGQVEIEPIVLHGEKVAEWYERYSSFRRSRYSTS